MRMSDYGGAWPECGRWESVTPVIVSVGVAVTPLVGGDGSRVAVVVSAAIAPNAVTSQFVDVGVQLGATFFPLVRLSGESPCAVLRLDEVGDVLWGPLVAQAEAAHNLTVSITRYHPFERP